jgi:hypothetical protein
VCPYLALLNGVDGEWQMEHEPGKWFAGFAWHVVHACVVSWEKVVEANFTVGVWHVEQSPG